MAKGHIKTGQTEDPDLALIVGIWGWPIRSSNG